MVSARVYSGMSAEERHRNRRTRLIEAATELIGTRGVAAATVTAVCAESGVTSRYFYQHFSDRDALLRAVYQQLYATFQEVIVDAIPDAGEPPEVLAYAPIRRLVGMIDNDPRLGRILFVESATEPLLRELRSELMAGFTDLVLREARLHLDIADSAWGLPIWLRPWAWEGYSKSCAADSTENWNSPQMNSFSTAQVSWAA